ncbi:MAG TPA: extracellular solute-binding protein [Trueperaceae bacterium]
MTRINGSIRNLVLVFIATTSISLLMVASAQESITLLIHPTLYEATGGEGGLVSEFTDATGIEVEVVTAPTDQLRERAVIEYVSGTGRFDVATLQDSWMNLEVAAFLEPLSDRFQATDNEYASDDIIQSLLAVNTVDGNLVAIPFRGGTTMLYYRKDLLEEAGVEPPTTIEELGAAAKELTREGVYGLVMRGVPGFEITQDFARLLFAHGGEILDESGTECLLDEPEGIATIAFWADLFQGGYMPPDTFALGRDDQIRMLQTGDAAMGIYFSPYYGRIVAETGPEVIGWSVTPTADGVEPGRSLNTLWSLAIDRNSDNKDAAWQLVQWLTNPENQLTMAVEYANAPVRASVYNDQGFSSGNPAAAGWLTATAASEFTPSHPRFAEMADIITIELTTALEGRSTPEEAAGAMCRQIDSLL